MNTTERHDGRNSPTNPNHCPVCGSTDTGVKFGFRPEVINRHERIVYDITHGCRDCEASWTAWGHHLIVQGPDGPVPDDGPMSDEAMTVLSKAIEASGELRIEIHPPEDGSPTET